MTAMRLFTREAFYAELVKNGFEMGEPVSSENTLWLHKETGIHFTIPHYADDGIPDFVLDSYLERVGKLYHEQGERVDCGSKQYGVSETAKKPSIILAKK